MCVGARRGGGGPLGTHSIEARAWFLQHVPEQCGARKHRTHSAYCLCLARNTAAVALLL